MGVVYRFRPKVTEGIDTFDALYGVEHEEFTRANDSLLTVFSNNFTKTADLEGVRNFERIYHIEENSSNSLEERRKIVYNKMIYTPPFTKRRLNLLLTDILGEGNFWFEIDESNFTIVVSISRLDRKTYALYIERIREIIPSNMLLVPSTPYTYMFLCGLIYGSNRTYYASENGDYDLVDGNYVYVGEGEGDYALSDETDFSNEGKLCHYTYRELSQYSIFDSTLETYPPVELDENEEWIPRDEGEIVDLEGAGSAHVSEM